jgi:hypothetical protein
MSRYTAPKFAEQLNEVMSTHVSKLIIRKKITSITFRFVDMGAQKLQL